jgi:hypothetical protein
MDLSAGLLLGHLVLGVVLGLAARPRPGDATQPWFDALLLFFLGSAVCDGLAALGLGAVLGINAYALAAGFLAGAFARRMPRRRPAVG